MVGYSGIFPRLRPPDIDGSRFEPKQERHQVDMKNAEAHANKLEAQLQELEECLQATHEEAIKELEVMRRPPPEICFG
jgi:multidrug resistance efflux pump